MKLHDLSVQGRWRKWRHLSRTTLCAFCGLRHLRRDRACHRNTFRWSGRYRSSNFAPGTEPDRCAKLVANIHRIPHASRALPPPEFQSRETSMLLPLDARLRGLASRRSTRRTRTRDRRTATNASTNWSAGCNSPWTVAASTRCGSAIIASPSPSLIRCNLLRLPSSAGGCRSGHRYLLPLRRGAGGQAGCGPRPSDRGRPHLWRLVSAVSSREYALAGAPARERGARLSEGIVVLRKLWTGEPVTHQGRFSAFEVQMQPPAAIERPADLVRRTIEGSAEAQWAFWPMAGCRTW